MSSRSMPSGYLRSVLHNGVGRSIGQLQRLTLKFCKERDGSRGMRDWIESSLLDFAKNNPGVVVYLQPRRHRAPKLYAEYLNGQVDTIDCNSYSSEEIRAWMEYLRTRSGIPVVRLKRQWHTTSPSVQGVWHPFLNKPSKLNITSLPNEELSRFLGPPSATEELLRMAANMKLIGDDEGASKGNKE